jgi:hypothetical protein
MPIHMACELSSVVAVALARSVPDIRLPLLVALVSHALVRLCSLVEFIPNALAFERAEPLSVSGYDARRWMRRSRTRPPLDLVTASACLAAMTQVAGV